MNLDSVLNLTGGLAILGVAGAALANASGIRGTPIPQENRPIILMITGGSAFSFIPAWMHPLTPYVEDVSVTYPTRATIIQTLGGAFCDDFGEGVTAISISGTTGWAGTIVPGELAFYNLRNMMIETYHKLREDLANAGADPDTVKMMYVDTLNIMMYEVYPVSFQMKRNKASPLLFRYTLQLAGLKKVL